MKKIIISENQLAQAIKQSVNKQYNWKYSNNFKAYQKNHPDDTFEFNRLPTYLTGLPVDILLDDHANYLHDNHPLWIYAHNGEINEVEQLLPILVHRFQPCVLIKKTKINISESTLKKIYNFIKKHYYLIVEYANARITHTDVENCLISESSLNEGFLFEMPTFYKGEVNLPTDIWIDAKRDLQHQARIKFNDKNNNNTRTWASMTIDKFNPIVKNLDPKTYLTNTDINIIKDFVKTNYETLIQSAKGQFASKSDILDSLNLDRDLSDLLQLDDKLNIEIVPIKDEFYFITDNNEKSIQYINYLSNIKPFKNYDNHSAYINIFNLKGDMFQKQQTIISTLKNVAKKLNVKLNIININSLKDYCQTTSKLKDLEACGFGPTLAR